MLQLHRRIRSHSIDRKESPVTNPIAPGSLTGKTAVVTGSSRGIGADTVRLFAAAGADVVINFRNKEARAVKLADEIRAAGGRAITVGADLTDRSSVDSLMDQVAAEFGSIDIL